MGFFYKKNGDLGFFFIKKEVVTWVCLFFLNGSDLRFLFKKSEVVTWVFYFKTKQKNGGSDLGFFYKRQGSDLGFSKKNKKKTVVTWGVFYKKNPSHYPHENHRCANGMKHRYLDCR